MKNWKASLFGLGAGALTLFANGANWKQVLFSVGIAAVGVFAKDSNVTGGSIPQYRILFRSAGGESLPRLSLP
jgi:hypothetical protein